MGKKRRKKVHLKFQHTENRKKDALRFLIAGLCFLMLITIFWNQSSTPLKSLSAGYQGYVLKGTLEEQMVDEAGVALIKEWLEQQTSPTLNPFKILFHYRRSTKPIENYDMAIGMAPTTEEDFREYAIYQSGNIIYLRVEPMGIDRVLTARFSQADLESALKPYITGEFRSTSAQTP